MHLVHYQWDCTRSSLAVCVIRSSSKLNTDNPPEGLATDGAGLEALAVPRFRLFRGSGPGQGGNIKASVRHE